MLFRSVEDLKDDEELNSTIMNLSVVGVGDSVMLGAAEELYDEFPKGYFDAKVSRSGWAAPGILQELKDKGMLGRGFDTDPNKPLTGGIQTTGNYPGRARTPEELMADIDMVLKLCPGTKKLNLHASYAIFEGGEWADRDKLEPKHFAKWVAFCKKRGLGCDFNPTFFSHPKANGLTLSSPDEEIRRFWIDHGKACIRISNYLAEELGQPCVMNIWTGDGFKDIPADRMGPRVRYREAIDEILSEPYDFTKVKPCIESKVFGIGVEAYTVGSAEFALSYAAFNKDKCIPLMDNGHYHPTEVVSDKIPALLAFFPEIALHITRPIRWDMVHSVFTGT